VLFSPTIPIIGAGISRIKFLLPERAIQSKINLKAAVTQCEG
jgi:hypothetical protein